jgi:putative Mg2+ transporter-C (MgtC) family protein
MFWQEIWDNIIHTEPGIAEIALRLACAMLVGSLIGLEREFTHRPAGLRTHILVALGACVVSILGEMLFNHYHALGASPDPARLSAQVITGVGFLGAGTIMKEGASVKGLTTAASVWAVACLGIAAGFGAYGLTLLGMVLTIITLTIFEALQRKLIRHHSSEDHFVVEAQDVTAALEVINEAAKGPKVTIFDLNVQRMEAGYRITFRAWYVGRKSRKLRMEFFQKLVTAESIETVRYDGVAEINV